MAFFEGVGGRKTNAWTYELSPFQYAKLRRIAFEHPPIFALIGPIPGENDPKEKLALIADERRQIEDLIDLGLLLDVSDKFQATVEQVRAENNRECRILTATERSKLMFGSKNKGSIN
jgi:hypothetical protein